jgi:RNA polymerase sigma-70 factor (ECF subfamily)
MIAPADIKVEFLVAIPKLRAFATIFCGCTVRADDLVQETLIRAWKNGGLFEPGSNLVAWCYTILCNAFYTEFQKPKQGAPDTDGQFASERNCDLVLKGHMNFRLALAELPPDHLEALTLVDGCGLHRAAFPMPRRKQSICTISDID